MRFAVVLLFALVSTLRLGAAEMEFLRLWPQWRDTESFQRIGEFFGGAENTGREIVLRTHPDQRDGYYFLVRVKHAASLAGGKFLVHVIRPDGPEAKLFTFPVPGAVDDKGETVFQLGLTGADWPGGKTAQPVAWKLELQSADGHPLVTQKSFLWEKPAK